MSLSGGKEEEWDNCNENNSQNYDFCRLYITSVPETLMREDLQQMFNPFGKLIECHLQTNKGKNYALIKYYKHEHAKAALKAMDGKLGMKIVIGKTSKAASKNKTVPLSSRARSSQINPVVEKFFNETPQSLSQPDQETKQFSGTDVRFELEDNFGSLARTANFNDIESEVDLDAELCLEIGQLRLLQAEICYKKRLKELKIAQKKAAKTQEMPSLKLSVEKRHCVVCKLMSCMFCERCQITPYCSTICQKSDWQRRHGAVCHNLANNPLALESQSRNQASSSVPTISIKNRIQRRPRNDI